MVNKSKQSPVEKKRDATSPVKNPPEGASKVSQPPVREGNESGGPKQAPGFATGDATPDHEG